MSMSRVWPSGPSNTLYLQVIGCFAAISIAGGVGAGVLFSTTLLFAPAAGPLAVADLDADGIPDLVTGGGVLLGNGDGTFQRAVASESRFLDSLAVADLDGDGVLDVVGANSRGSDVDVLLGNGDGSFQPAVAVAVGFGPSSVAGGRSRWRRGPRCRHRERPRP